MTTPDAAPISSIRATPAVTKIAANRGWALDNADATVKVKPRRPYTPYNLFYLLERELVVQGKGPSVVKEKALKKAAIMAADIHGKYAKIKERLEEDISIPERYKNVVLMPMWYEPNLKEKRKHRKTHGKISFKDLTEIISKNWANIDTETKSYCTRVSEIGRKSYKETMAKYNASQKIIQLKKEHAAMESAREKRMNDQHNFQTKQECVVVTPSRRAAVEKRGKRSNPVTPDRSASHHNAPIVTTPSFRSNRNNLSHLAPVVTPSSHSGYNNRVPMFVPSGAHAAYFHHYGPPPPMPPSMPHSHSMQCQQQLSPHSMQQMYHQHPHQRQHQHRHAQYNYPQVPAMNKMNHNGHPQAPAMSKVNHNGHDHRQAAMSMNNNGYYDGRDGRGNNFFNLPNEGGVDLNVNVKNVCEKKEDHASSMAASIHRSPTTRTEKSSMTHDEAIRLCTLMESPGRNYCTESGPSGPPLMPCDTFLQEMPSFDFGDHHSLFTDEGNGDSTSQETSGDGLLDQVEYQEYNMLDLIRGEFPPLDLGEVGNGFPDISLDYVSRNTEE